MSENSMTVHHNTLADFATTSMASGRVIKSDCTLMISSGLWSPCISGILMTTLLQDGFDAIASVRASLCGLVSRHFLLRFTNLGGKGLFEVQIALEEVWREQRAGE